MGAGAGLPFIGAGAGAFLGRGFLAMGLWGTACFMGLAALAGLPMGACSAATFGGRSSLEPSGAVVLLSNRMPPPCTLPSLLRQRGAAGFGVGGVLGFRQGRQRGAVRLGRSGFLGVRSSSAGTKGSGKGGSHEGGTHGKTGGHLKILQK